VIRIILKGEIRLSLFDVLDHATSEVRASIKSQWLQAAMMAGGANAFAQATGMRPVKGHPEPVDTGVLDVLDFLTERLRVQLRAEGARHDILTAVLASGADDDLVRLLARAEAVRAFLVTDAGTNLLAAAKRAQNILRIEEKKEGAPFPPGFTASEGAPEQERALAEALATARNAVTATLASEDFAGAMTAMAQLRTPLDAFFEHVIVNHSDNEIRHNRLQLLSGLRTVLDQVADFSKIEG
jgi:glycyl-tRNA synthetase beta chain